MSEVASRELCNQTRALFDRVAVGERITITVDGRSVAELTPTAMRARWMARERFIGQVLPHRADAALAEVPSSLTDETTDDLPL